MTTELVFFTLNNPVRRPRHENFPSSNEVILSYNVPTLSAYQVVHMESDSFNCPMGETSFAEVQFSYDADVVNVTCRDLDLFRPAGSQKILKVYVSGILDYQYFFSFVVNPKKKQVLAEFLEESDKAYHSSSALSFALMAGAVCESVLHEVLGGKEHFGDLINRAKEKGLFTNMELEHLEQLRQSRNKVHVKRVITDGGVQRGDMVELKHFLDVFLKRDWRSIET
jgi:hypothetical protein